MARILIVKPLFPYPPHQGTRRVSLGLLRDLATAHEVVYLCQREQRAEARLIPEVERLGVRVVAPLMPNHRSPAHKLWYKVKNRVFSRLSGVPELSLYWSNVALRANLERLGRELQPELTIIENWELYPLHRSIRHGRAALLAHDAAFQILERAVAASTTEADRARRQRRLEHERQLEISAWRLYDAILTLTESDRDTVVRELETASAPLPLVQHLPVPVADEFFGFTRPASPGARVGFLGTFRADFNRDALTYLLREIWPRVIARLPQAKLVIAGNSHAGALRAEAEARGAHWLGFVADLQSFYDAIDVLIVPLRFGGGVRIRMLEAFAAGVPVVATPIAAAGLGVEDGVQYRSAGAPDELAAAVAAMLQNPAEAAALGRQGQAWCAREHGPDVLRPRRLAAVQAILELPPRAAAAHRRSNPK
jgi:glycosyltransferase involved in cell wall biosynthesis